VSYATKNATVPWFAIGGIDQSNLGDVLKAGAKQVAVVRVIMQSPDPTKATQDLLEQLQTLS
jgi:thiamine-phosphate pyrophosphorylase